MSFIINKLHNRIYTIENNNDGYIYKLSDCSIANEFIVDEFNMFDTMSKKNKAFQVYDKLYTMSNINNKIGFRFGDHSILCNKNAIFPNFDEKFPDKKLAIMRAKYDSNLITVYNVYLKYNKPIITVISSILNIVNTVFRPNNFIHGDFKCNNILYHISTNDIKIIDLEFSVIVDDYLLLDENATVNLYLNSTDTKVTKRFLFLFDIYILVKSILSCPTYFPLNLYEKLLDIYDNYLDNETFMDFIVIYSMIKNIPVKKTSECTIDASYSIMMSELTVIPSGIFNKAFEEHVVIIHNILATNIRLNLHNISNIDNIDLDVIEKTIYDNDHVMSIDNHSDNSIIETSDVTDVTNDNGKRKRSY